jgi:hypothetical protein
MRESNGFFEGAGGAAAGICFGGEGEGELGERLFEDCMYRGYCDSAKVILFMENILLKDGFVIEIERCDEIRSPFEISINNLYKSIIIEQ